MNLQFSFDFFGHFNADIIRFQILKIYWFDLIIILPMYLTFSKSCSVMMSLKDDALLKSNYFMVYSFLQYDNLSFVEGSILTGLRFVKLMTMSFDDLIWFLNNKNNFIWLDCLTFVCALSLIVLKARAILVSM